MNDSSGREIITLQVGRYANFVGTHFWNFQDELVLLASRGGVVDAPYHHGTGNCKCGELDYPCVPPHHHPPTCRDALGCLNPLGLRCTSHIVPPCLAFYVSVFRQPPLERNALHEYLDNEDAAINTVNTVAPDGGGYATTQQGWGTGGQGGSSQGQEEDEDNEEMEGYEAMVTGDVTRLSKHPFGLDDTVSTWPDFLKARLHPKALQELPFRDESSDFAVYTSGGGGRNGALDESDREKQSDALRQQLEECDAAQGTQTLVDLEGGWAGLGTALASELQEECRNRPRVCYAFLRRGGAPTGPGCRVPGAMGGGAAATAGPSGASGAARSAVNLALGLHGLCESFSLSFVVDEEACNAQLSPHMAVDPLNAYHTSAVLGAAVDVATSPLRFCGTGLDAWASNCSSGGGVPMTGGGGAFGGGGRAPPPGADMTLATLSAWLPLPYPDASAETLQQILSDNLSASRRSEAGDGRSPSGFVANVASSTLVSLGPVQRRRRGDFRVRMRQPMGTAAATAAATAAGGGAARVFSRKMVTRGFTAPRGQQLDLLEQVLHHSGVGSGSSFSVATPLPIPITYPLLFRESLGLRGELLSNPPLSPPPPPQAGSRTVSVPSGGARTGVGREQGEREGDGQSHEMRGELRVMCDEISGVACAEKASDMGSFISQVVSGFDVRRGGVLLELQKNDMHKDDAFEVIETLKGLSESYGYSEDDEE
ncbi:unnamed protein product [Scytosiphon promiscuus]